MKTILSALIAVVFLANPVWAETASNTVVNSSELEGVMEAHQGNLQNLLDEIKRLKTEKYSLKTSMPSEFQLFSDDMSISRKKCDDDSDDRDPVTCVPKCTNRGSSGTCYTYDKDFCGEGATCVPNCLNRGSSGTCYIYGEDLCGTSAETCVPKCTNRGSSGKCYIYDKDFCGPAASCTPNCLNRGSSGTCYTYGEDICY